jgi:hypothetical protein
MPQEDLRNHPQVGLWRTARPSTKDYADFYSRPFGQHPLANGPTGAPPFSDQIRD